MEIKLEIDDNNKIIKNEININNMENIINEYFNKSTKILESEKCFNEEELLAY